MHFAVRLLGRIDRATDWRENLATLVSMRLALDFALIPRGPPDTGFFCPPAYPSGWAGCAFAPALPLHDERAGVKVVISVSFEQWTGQRLELCQQLRGISHYAVGIGSFLSA